MRRLLICALLLAGCAHAPHADPTGKDGPLPACFTAPHDQVAPECWESPGAPTIHTPMAVPPRVIHLHGWCTADWHPATCISHGDNEPTYEVNR